MKKILSYVLIGAVVMFNGFMLVEGGFASADTTSTISTTTPIYLEYPVELEVSEELVLTCDVTTVAMSPNIAGITGGTATGARECLVRTNNFGGYTLSAKAASDPAMQHTVNSATVFANYTGTPNTITWATVADSVAEFGYNATGVQATNNGIWYALTDSDFTVASSSVATSFVGVTTSMNYQAQAGDKAMMPSGLYRANVIMTALMN